MHLPRDVPAHFVVRHRQDVAPLVRETVRVDDSPSRDDRRRVREGGVRNPIRPHHSLSLGDSEGQETATDGVQFQDNVNVRQNILLSRSGTSVTATEASHPQEPRARKAALMVLFAGFLVFAFPAYLNVKPSGAIVATRTPRTIVLPAVKPNVPCAA